LFILLFISLIPIIMILSKSKFMVALFAATIINEKGAIQFVFSDDAAIALSDSFLTMIDVEYPRPNTSGVADIVDAHGKSFTDTIVYAGYMYGLYISNVLTQNPDIDFVSKEEHDDIIKKGHALHLEDMAAKDRIINGLSAKFQRAETDIKHRYFTGFSKWVYEGGVQPIYTTKDDMQP